MRGTSDERANRSILSNSTTFSSRESIDMVSLSPNERMNLNNKRMSQIDTKDGSAGRSLFAAALNFLTSSIEETGIPNKTSKTEDSADIAVLTAEDDRQCSNSAWRKFTTSDC